MVLVLSSCNTESRVKTTQSNVNDINIPKNDDSITMILLNTAIGKNDIMMGVYMENLLAEVGFDIEIKFFRFNYLNYGGAKKEYEEMIREELKQGENVLFECVSDINELIADNLIYNFGTDDGYYIPIGRNKTYAYTGLYINKDLEDKYGRAINSTGDYEDFLKWVADSNANMTPGLIIIDSYTGELYSPIALFAQESGYARADYAIGNIGEGGTTLYIDINEIGQSAVVVPRVYEAAKLPFFHEMEKALVRWSNSGYIKFQDRYETLNLGRNYASLVVNLGDTTDYYSWNYMAMQWRLIDVSGFNLHIITKDGLFNDTPMVKLSGPSSRFAVSAKSPSPSVMKDLLDWIYSSQENYLYFMCGKEGTDYYIKDGRYSFIENKLNITYGLWHKHTSFIDSDFDLVMPHFPANWIELSRTLEHVENTSVVKIIGYENIEADLAEIVNEGLGNPGLSLAYKQEVKSKYSRFFDDIINGEREYRSGNLLKDINASQAAANKKQAYEEYLTAICGGRY